MPRGFPNHGTKAVHLSQKDGLALSNFIVENYTKSNMSCPEFANLARKTLGISLINADHVRHRVAGLEIPFNSVRAAPTKGAVDPQLVAKVDILWALVEMCEPEYFNNKVEELIGSVHGDIGKLKLESDKFTNMAAFIRKARQQGQL